MLYTSTCTTSKLFWCVFSCKLTCHESVPLSENNFFSDYSRQNMWAGQWVDIIKIGLVAVFAGCCIYLVYECIYRIYRDNRNNPPDGNSPTQEEREVN